LRVIRTLALDPQLRDKALELYFRGYEDKSRNPRATLYLGTTRVVHVWFSPRQHRFKLEGQVGTSFTRESLPHEPQRVKLDPGLFKSQWAEWQAAGDLARDQKAITTYLRAVIQAAPASHLREGRLQARLSSGTRGITILDRELMLSGAELAKARAPIQAAIERVRAQSEVHDETPWVGNVNEHQAKLDALAVDAKGRVLLIEVKRISETTEASRTPAQVALYLSIFQEWAEQHPAEAVLGKMLKRRVELGLTKHPPTKLDTSHLIPVIAFGGECKSAKSKDTINKRMTPFPHFSIVISPPMLGR